MGLTPGTPADCPQAVDLRAGLEAEYLVADRGYDSAPVVAAAGTQGMVPGISLRRHHRCPRTYDPARYPWRHRGENAFLAFQPWRGVATRYAQNAAAFLAICPIRALALGTQSF